MTCTLTVEPAGPPMKKRILLESSAIHIGGVVAELPVGSLSDERSRASWRDIREMHARANGRRGRVDGARHD